MAYLDNIATFVRVVEINTVNSAGFYAADVQKLVMSLDDLRR